MGQNDSYFVLIDTLKATQSQFAIDTMLSFFDSMYIYIYNLFFFDFFKKKNYELRNIP